MQVDWIPSYIPPETEWRFEVKPCKWCSEPVPVGRKTYCSDGCLKEARLMREEINKNNAGIKSAMEHGWHPVPAQPTVTCECGRKSTLGYPCRCGRNNA
jgi:hypothetical protein